MRKKIKNILVVDDEEDICFLVKSVLKRNTEAQIDICTNVSHAIKQLSSVDYDMAFFDMRLNDGSGEDLIKYIQENLEVSPYIAVISAYTSSSDMKKLDELAISQFIPKPLTREKIINCYLAAAS